jgi:hypothetical protein
MAAMSASMDLALALPTLSVVEGSLLGSGGGCVTPPCSILLGSVDDVEWRHDGGGAAPEEDDDDRASASDSDADPSDKVSGPVTVTTVSETRSPAFRMRLTTVSWLACVTSAPLI